MVTGPVAAQNQIVDLSYPSQSFESSLSALPGGTLSLTMATGIDGELSSLQYSSYLSLTGLDPVRGLCNYLQEVKKENLNQYLSFTAEQTGNNNEVVHTGMYTC